MTEDDLRRLLRTAAPEPGPAPVEAIVAAGRSRARRVRLVQVGVTAAVIVTMLLVAVTLLGRPVPGPSAAAGACPSSVAPAVLPGWARGGFSEPEPVTPYVLGDRGDVVAIVFGELSQPPRPGTNNKILWVVRDGAGAPFTITARPSDAAVPAVVTTLSDGAGPSTVDVPQPGCWSFALRWGTHHDELVLPYGG